MAANERQEPHEHSSEDTFVAMLGEAEKCNASQQSVSTTFLASDHQLFDNYTDADEKERSYSISKILECYRKAYSGKVDFQQTGRKILLIGCGIIVCAFVFAVLAVLIYTLRNASGLDLTGMAAVITAVVSLVVSILKIIQIITQYCFPRNDEQYIVKIVESIQTNDLEKFKESNRAVEAQKEKSRNFSQS